MNLETLPERIKNLPRDERGYPVPWFVAIIDGKPDFRAIDGEKMHRAVKEHRCWVCGEALGSYLAFVIGPMCALNRTIAEPPSHRECAEFSALACPFLSQPRMRRNTVNMPEEAVPAAGVGLERNPGACCVWVTKSYRILRVENGVLFSIGEPLSVSWFANGRAATRAEILESIESGMPLLRPIAEAESPEAVAELDRRYKHVVETLVPA